MNNAAISHQKTKTLTLLALFTAIVVVLQFVGSAIKLGPFSISLVLVPIVIGAAMCGAKAGAWLGFVFGVVVLLSGDAAAFLQVNPLGTVIVVLVKGAMAGLCAGLVYKALEKKSDFGATLAAAITAPVVNTGIFLIGCYIFFLPTVSGWAEGAGFGANVGRYMILGLVGGNFLVELAINVVLVSVITRLIRVGKKDTEQNA